MSSKEHLVEFEKLYNEVIQTAPDPPEELKKISLRSIIKYFGFGALIAAIGVGSGELIWTPRAAAAFGYIITWAFFYGVWTKAVIQYLGMKLFTITGEPPSHALKRVFGGWLVIFLATMFVAVTPFWFVSLGTLSAQIIINSIGLPTTYQTLIFYALLTISLLMVVFSAYLKKALKVLEWVQSGVMIIMLVFFWVAVGVAVRPDWGSFFAYMFVPILPPDYEPWVRQVAKDIAATPVMWFILPALGALGAGAHEYIGYTAVFDEKGWGVPASPKWEALRRAFYGVPRTFKLPIPTTGDMRVKLNAWRRAPLLTVLIGFIALWISTTPAIILSIEVLRPQHLIPSGIKLTAVQAEWLRIIHPSLTVLWWIGAFVAIWGTFYGVFEVYVWTLHDFLRAFKRFENLSRNTVRKYLWPYYVIATALLYSTGFSVPFLATFASAVLNIFSTGVWGLALIYLDRTQLPKEYRAPLWYIIFTLIGALLYAFWGLTNMIQAFGISPY
ncbi:MAG: Nramp family divalent metal transporter [Sulfolobales archaeon]